MAAIYSDISQPLTGVGILGYRVCWDGRRSGDFSSSFPVQRAFRPHLLAAFIPLLGVKFKFSQTQTAAEPRQ